MTAAKTRRARHNKPKSTGLKVALLFVNEEVGPGERWGWWCPRCTTDDKRVGHDGYKHRDSAGREAKAHETRRGH